MIIDIQRFSLNDGPGIRTTVFLKGCPLHCAWCHNPEAIHAGREMMLYPEKCIGCGRCAAACKTGARRVEDGRLVYEAEKCVSCGACANECFTGAIQVSGVEMTVSEIVDEVMKDADYYRRSGGGVTLSGGEVLMQPQLAKDILKALKDRGVSTAIESSLYADWSLIADVLENVDLVMADLKIADDEQHQRWVGVSNRKIVENLRALNRLGKPLILRTPVIPGINDSNEAIQAIAKIAKDFDNLQYYELLNYNPLGESKYQALNREYLLAGARPLAKERMEELKQTAIEAGLNNVRVG